MSTSVIITSTVYTTLEEEKTLRPSFDEYFLMLADTVSTRGDCTRAKVGAVLVHRDNHTIWIGYNGTPQPKQPGCLDGACPRGQLSFDDCPPYSDYSNCIAVHAEANALDSCLRNGGDPRGCTIYITRDSCGECRVLLWEAEVSRVVWPGGQYFLLGG